MYSTILVKSGVIVYVCKHTLTPNTVLPNHVLTVLDLQWGKNREVLIKTPTQTFLLGYYNVVTETITCYITGTQFYV